MNRRRIRHRGLESRDVLGEVQSGSSEDGYALLNSLRDSVSRGGRSTFASLVAKQGSRVLLSLLLARILGPQDFAVVSLVTLYVTFTGLVLDFGFGAALIQRDEVEETDMGTVATLNLLTALAVSLVTIVSAGPVARFFHLPALASPLRVLVVAVCFQAFSVVPVARLTRAFDFRSLARVEASTAVLSAVVAIAAAFAGAGYWSIVIGVLVLDGSNAVWLTSAAGWTRLAWSASSARSLFAFGRNVMGSQFIRHFAVNVDNVLVGRYLGPIALSNYALAYRVLILPSQTLGQVLRRVLFPALSRLQSRPERLGHFYAQASSSVALIILPLLALVAMAAPVAIPLMFGPEWSPAILPTQIFALGAIAQSLGFQHLVFLACGKTKLVFNFTLATTALSVGGFVIGLRWGIGGVAAAYAITRSALWPVAAWYVRNLVGLSIFAYFRSLAPAAASSVALAAAWGLTRFVLESAGFPVVPAAAVATGAGVAAYVGVLGIVSPQQLQRLRRLSALAFRPHRSQPNVHLGTTKQPSTASTERPDRLLTDSSAEVQA